MTRGRHRRSRQLARRALLSLFALGVLLQGVVATMGDLHEWVLHASAGEVYTHGHAHDVHHGDVHHGDEDPADPGDGDVLHALQHQPCGGHAALMVAADPVTSGLQAGIATLPSFAAQLIAASDYAAPFRPPIA